MEESKRIIKIVDFIGTKMAITTTNGIKVFDLIKSCIDSNEKIILDFSNISLVTTAFLNAAIGQLYKDYNTEIIKKHLDVLNLKPADTNMINKVISRAKEFFKDPEGFTDNTENSIYGG